MIVTFIYILLNLLKSFNHLIETFKFKLVSYVTMVTHSEELTQTEPKRLSLESIEYVESQRLSKYEPFYAIMNRVIDKAKALDKKKVSK